MHGDAGVRSLRPPSWLLRVYGAKTASGDPCNGSSSLSNPALLGHMLSGRLADTCRLTATDEPTGQHCGPPGGPSLTRACVSAACAAARTAAL